MPQLDLPQDWNVEVSPDLLLERIGSSRCKEKMLELCRATIKEGEKLLAPRCLYNVFSLKEINDNQIILENGFSFRSIYLAKLMHGADRAVITCCTIGPELQERVRDLDQEGNQLNSYMLDIYGASAVGELMKTFYKYLKEEKFAGLGCTITVEPGQLDWDVREQRAIFELLSPQKIGVELGSGCLMMPLKSLTGVFGIGDAGKVEAGYPSCKYCPRRETCVFKMDLEELKQMA